MKDIELWKGDCLELMDNIPDNSVDMILADLPYGTTACRWDTIIPLDLLWKQYERIIKKKSAIVLFGSQPFSSVLVSSNLKLFRYEIIWNKVKPSNFQMMNFQVGRVHENIYVFSKSPAVYSNGQEMRYYPQKTKLEKPKKLFVKMYGTRNSTLRNGHTIKDAGNKEYTERHPTSIKTLSNANMSKKKFHPTQKPEELLEWLIKSFTLENEIVLDNTMGSGSTGVACKSLNRKFIGIEKEKEYFNIAKKRINE